MTKGTKPVNAEVSLLGTVTLISAGTEVDVEIFDTPECSSLAYAVRKGFDGGYIVEDDDNKVRVVRLDGSVVLAMGDPEDYILRAGDKAFIAKIHGNG